MARRIRAGGLDAGHGPALQFIQIAGRKRRFLQHLGNELQNVLQIGLRVSKEADNPDAPPLILQLAFNGVSSSSICWRVCSRVPRTNKAAVNAPTRPCLQRFQRAEMDVDDAVDPVALGLLHQIGGLDRSGHAAFDPRFEIF